VKPASLLTGAGAARRARIRSALHRHCPCEPLEPRRLLASVAGIVFQDDNGNNVRDAGELALTGRTVYIDADNDHRLGAAERAFITGPDGAYRFDGLAASNQFLGQVVPAGWKKSTAVAVVGLAEGATARYDLGSVASPPPTATQPATAADPTSVRLEAG